MRVIICKANEFPVRYDPAAPPGKAFSESRFPRSMFVAAGLIDSDERSVVEVTELQPAGKRRMPAEEFLRGNVVTDAKFGAESPE